MYTNSTNKYYPGAQSDFQVNGESITNSIINQKYYDGDIWDFWIGPMPLPQDDPNGEIATSIRKIFQSANYVRECVDRQVDAVLGRYPHWYLGDRIGRKIESAEAEEMLQAWLNRTQALAVGQKSKSGDPWSKALTDACIHGRGYLRLWSPRRFRNNPDPTRRLCVHAPNPSSVEVEYDEDDIAYKISYSFTATQNVHPDIKPEIVAQKEIQYIDEAGYTVIYKAIGDEPIETPIRLNLGGRFTIQEIKLDSLITDSVRRLQNAIAFTLTMLIRNLVTSGFAERYLLNAQQPGEYIDDGRGGQIFNPSGEFKVGPGQTAFLVGIPQIDAISGQAMGYANPSVAFRDPVPVDTFQMSLDILRAEIYHQFKQGHLLSSDSGVMSGLSRVQLRQDFETALQKQGTIVSHAIAQCLGAALSMLSPDYANTEIIATPRLSASKPMPEERDANRADFQAGLLSLATAIAQTGVVDDTDAELQLIEEDKQTKLNDMAATNKIMMSSKVVAAAETAPQQPTN